jgi:hypothetical protein
MSETEILIAFAIFFAGMRYGVMIALPNPPKEDK